MGNDATHDNDDNHDTLGTLATHTNTINKLVLHVFLGDLNLTAGIDMYLTRVKKYSSFL